MKKYVKADEENLDMDDTSEDFKAAKALWDTIDDAMTDLENAYHQLTLCSYDYDNFKSNHFLYRVHDSAQTCLSDCEDDLADIMDTILNYKPKVNWD